MPAPKYKYVEGMPSKVCGVCEEEKLVEEFTKSSRCVGGRSHKCKVCSNAENRKRRQLRHLDPIFVENLLKKKAEASDLAAKKRLERGPQSKAKFKYVKGSQTKVCSKCEIEQGVGCFTKNNLCFEGRVSVCNTCNNSRGRAWRANEIKTNPEFVSARKLSQRKARAKRYGISLDELEMLEMSSQGRCEICKNEPTLKGGSSNSLHVDHNHGTGDVRGLLCARCNVSLGQVNDSVSVLRGMIEYLLKYGDCND